MPSNRFVRNRRNFLQTAAGLTTCCYLSPWPALAQEATPKSPTVATGKRGVVATVQPLASRAAVEAFERGGNAIDAAVAASLMLSVVDGHNSGIGGGCLALVRTASGDVFAIVGRERAPMKATPEMFFRDGKPDPTLSQVGPLAAGVPGLIAAPDQLPPGRGSRARSCACRRGRRARRWLWHAHTAPSRDG